LALQRATMASPQAAPNALGSACATRR
jgi:hypothetical protein